MSMMWFSFGRIERLPTQYAQNQTPVTVDVLEAGFITAFVILLICFIIYNTTRIIEWHFSEIIRVTVSLSIGLLLLLANFGQEWEIGRIMSRMPYRAGSPVDIHALVGMKIGLRSVNVTLATNDVPPELKKEIINYNERFEWTWDQGRFGFGPYAGHLQQQFRAAQNRGLPIPILWIVDYFVIDGEGYRFGRFYRTAGWYSHIALWTAFACWLLANILFRSVIRYGGYFMGICGALQLTANLVWWVVRNPKPLVIPFEDATLTTKFGLNFWLNFATGIFCLVVCGAIVLMDNFADDQLHSFFGVDPLNALAEVKYLTKEERELLRPKVKHSRTNDNFSRNDVPLIEVKPGPSTQSDEEGDDQDQEYVPVYMKRRTIMRAPTVIRSNKPLHLMPKV